ncbi:MAG TPA: hypothetical protein VGB55_11700, partial [Tepidisphaeraceae bacterium]
MVILLWALSHNLQERRHQRGVGVSPARKNKMQNKPRITRIDTNQNQSALSLFVSIRGFFF